MGGLSRVNRNSIEYSVLVISLKRSDFVVFYLCIDVQYGMPDRCCLRTRYRTGRTNSSTRNRRCGFRIDKIDEVYI